MKFLLESDREVTVDGVGLLKAGEPVEVNPTLFSVFHGKKLAEAKFPSFIMVTIDLDDSGEEV